MGIMMNDKYYEPFCDRGQHLPPLVYSVDGLTGKETRTVERKLASLLAGKLHKKYYEIALFVCTHMNLPIVRAKKEDT